MIDQITIGLFNATGIDHSPDELLQFCNDHHINLIIITETFLTRGNLYTNWHQYHNYAIQSDPQHRGQDGISLLVRPDLNLHIHHTPNLNQYTLTFRLGDYTIYALYLPPSLAQVHVPNCLHIFQSLSMLSFLAT